MDKRFLDTITATNQCTLKEYVYVYPRLMKEHINREGGNDNNELSFIEEQIEEHLIYIEIEKDTQTRILDIGYVENKHGKYEDYRLMVMSFNNQIISLKAIIKYLETKKSELEYPQQISDSKTDEVLINEFDKIFKNDIGFTIFSKMFELYKNETNHLANFSFLFYAMEKDFLVCSQTEFKEFLRIEKYNVDIEKIDSRQSGENKKAKLYNSIKEKYRPSTIKAQ